MSSSRTGASERLGARKEVVLQRWQERAREEISAAASEPDPILLDTLPGFLDALVEALSTRHPRASATQGSTVAREHGSERVRLTDFNLSDLIREYQLLRDVLFQVLEEDGPLSSWEREVIVASIDTGMRDACAAYVRLAERARERMTMTLVHDLRGPLGAVKTAAALIQRRPADAAVPRLSARIDRAIDRADAMLRTLLDVSRAESGMRLSLEIGPCDLVAIIDDVVGALTLAHGARIEVSAPDALHGYWSGDALARALENLLTNALKYGDRTRPITVRAGEAHDRVTLAVHNQGSVIPGPERARLFEAFSRSREAEASGVRGWGLGLALVRAVAEAHGGSVSVDSLPGLGTTFTLDVPRDARPFQAAPTSLVDPLQPH